MKSHLDRLRFRHLLLVEALGADKSLRQAALRLGMTQPGCSKLLRELEFELGVVLFHRTASGVVPTPYGEVLIRSSHLMLTHANAAIQEFETIESDVYTRVRVGMYGVALSAFVADVVEQLRGAAPRMLIVLEEGTGDSLLTALAKGDIDCVIGRGRQRSAGTELTQIPLFFEQVLVVARRNHPLARRKRVSLEELARLEWVLPSPSTLLRSKLEELFAQHRIGMPACFVESSVHLANQELLPKGDQVCLFPQTLAKTLAANGALSVLPIVLPLDLPPVTLWACGHAPYPMAVDKFIQAGTRVAESWAQRR